MTPSFARTLLLPALLLALLPAASLAARPRPVPVDDVPPPRPAREGAKNPWRFERLGVALSFYGESSRMQGFTGFRDGIELDESFDYRPGSPLSLSAWLLAEPAPGLRVGPGLRVFGGYGGGNGGFDFGLLNELFLTGEWGLRAIEQVELVLGARGGLALLLPGGQFAEEIARLQKQGAGVWSVPRVGWLGGLSLGLRRRMWESLYLRLDFNGQVERIYLFATDEVIDSLRFRKQWSNDVRRVGVDLAVELAF